MSNTNTNPTTSPQDGNAPITTGAGSTTAPLPPVSPLIPPLDGAANAQNTAQHTGAQAVLAWIDNDDLNGECFIAGEIGEREEVRGNRIVGFLRSSPMATTPGQAVNFTGLQASAFISLNVKMLALSYTEVPKVLHYQIAYVRFLAARAGLISPAFRTQDFHVRYNEAEVMDGVALTNVNNFTSNAQVAAVPFTAAQRAQLRNNFANMVCAVAYMFRVRGHHHLDEMDNKYKALWKKCLKDDDTPGFDWKYVAHDALHAIIPQVLDDYWQAMKDEGKIAGALVKRFDSAPAGVAAVRAVYAGAQDLQMAVPGIRERFKSHFDDLDVLVNKMRVERWAGSINRRYYNASAVDFDEQKFGAIASVVWHALNSFANNSQLLKSNALIRVANNAPITGGIVSRSIATAASDPALVKAMLNINDPGH